jgi:adenylyltransferase/sulfurtransferase
MTREKSKRIQPPLSDEDRERFARPLRLPEVGAEGQARLRSSSVLVVGAGGLGCAALIHLAASGVGRLGIVDPDRVERSNLHRQIAHGTADLGTAKTESARRRLQMIDPRTGIDVYDIPFSESNAEDLARPYDLVVDATDNLAARHAINRACIRQGKAMVYGSAQRFEGQLSVFDADRGPCFRCIFPDLKDSTTVESPAESGVFGPIPGMIGTLQALEAMKILLNIGDGLIGRLLTFDGLSGMFTEIRIRKNPRCPECRRIG